MGIFKRFMGRLSEDSSDRRVQQVQRWAHEIPGVVPIGQVTARSMAKVAGVVESLRVRPRQGTPSIEASLSDGTGSCTAVWLGRRSVHGLVLGRRMVIEGRVAMKDGDLQIMNPTFEFADARVIEERMKDKPGKA